MKQFKKIDEVIKNGKALDKFYEFVQAQGGDVQALKNPSFWNPKYKLEVQSDKSGYVEIFDSLTFGIVAMKLGAGRKTKEDLIDFEAGITINKKTNEKVEKGDVLFTLYSSSKIDLSIIQELKNGYRINQDQVENQVILDRMK